MALVVVALIGLSRAPQILVGGGAQLGETCEGFNEITGKQFPACAQGLVCQSSGGVSIPGAGKKCIKPPKQEDSTGACACLDVHCPNPSRGPAPCNCSLCMDEEPAPSSKLEEPPEAPCACPDVYCRNPIRGWAPCNCSLCMDQTDDGCTLAGGEEVASGWRGKDTGDNYCNSCRCPHGGGALSCTEMMCAPKDEQEEEKEKQQSKCKLGQGWSEFEDGVYVENGESYTDPKNPCKQGTCDNGHLMEMAIDCQPSGCDDPWCREPCPKGQKLNTDDPSRDTCCGECVDAAPTKGEPAPSPKPEEPPEAPCTCPDVYCPNPLRGRAPCYCSLCAERPDSVPSDKCFDAFGMQSSKCLGTWLPDAPLGCVMRDRRCITYDLGAAMRLTSNYFDRSCAGLPTRGRLLAYICQPLDEASCVNTEDCEWGAECKPRDLRTRGLPAPGTGSEAYRGLPPSEEEEGEVPERVCDCAPTGCEEAWCLKCPEDKPFVYPAGGVCDCDACHAEPEALEAPGVCCEAETAKCKACKVGASVQVYCRRFPETVGCEPLLLIPRPPRQPPYVAPPPPTVIAGNITVEVEDGRAEEFAVNFSAAAAMKGAIAEMSGVGYEAVRIQCMESFGRSIPPPSVLVRFALAVQAGKSIGALKDALSYTRMLERVLSERTEPRDPKDPTQICNKHLRLRKLQFQVEALSIKVDVAKASAPTTDAPSWDMDPARPEKKPPSSAQRPAVTTALSEGAAAGATVLKTVDETGFAAGDKILIGGGTPLAETNSILRFGSMILASPLVNSHLAGTSITKVEEEGSATVFRESQRMCRGTLDGSRVRRTICDTYRTRTLALRTGGVQTFAAVLDSFLSAPGLSVNVQTEEAHFKIHDGRLKVNGSFLTEAHVVARVGRNGRFWALVSYWASELGEHNWGWQVVNGTCAGRPFKFGRGAHKSCFELTMSMEHSSAVFTLRDWTITVHGMGSVPRAEDWIAGPRHRLDISFSARGEAPVLGPPHGLIGQSFASDMVRSGKVDIYPRSGEFTTSAMAEGAIEGDAAMYEVASRHATQFAFSRFDATAHKVAARPLAGAVDASSVESVA